MSERSAVEWSGVEWSRVEWSGVEWSGECEMSGVSEMSDCVTTRSEASAASSVKSSDETCAVGACACARASMCWLQCASLCAVSLTPA